MSSRATPATQKLLCVTKLCVCVTAGEKELRDNPFVILYDVGELYVQGLCVCDKTLCAKGLCTEKHGVTTLCAKELPCVTILYVKEL